MNELAFTAVMVLVIVVGVAAYAFALRSALK